MVTLTGDSLKTKRRYHQGMILSEILLAGAIISIALASVVVVIGCLQSMVIDAQNSFEAMLKARETLASVYLLDFNDLVSFEKKDDIFTTNFSVAYRNAFTADISADVSWFEGTFQKHRIISDQIVDWSRAAGEADCDWLDEAKGNLKKVNSTILNIDDGNPVMDVATLGGYVYVSADSATSSLPDLYVIDVRDIQNPQIVAHLNTGPGIASIATANHYIFAANAGSYQMQIIDVNDPAHPTLVSQAKMPGAVISGSAGFGNAVHFFDNKMYLGLNKNTGPEFFIVDVSNPKAPVELGSFEIGGTVNDIDVQNGRAVVVSPGQASVFLLDTSHPSTILEKSRLTLSGWQTQSAQSVEMLGPEVIVGRSLGGFYSLSPELMFLNQDQNHSQLVLATTSLKVDASVENILEFNDYVYMTTSDADRAFQILQNSMPIFSEALSARGVALTCNRQGMYVVTQNGQDFFHIFSSTLTQP